LLQICPAGNLQEKAAHNPGEDDYKAPA